MPASVVVVIVFVILRPQRVVQQLLTLLADDGLLVSALNVVPLDPVLRCERSHVGLSSNVMTHAVDVVEDADAGLLPAALLLLPVVRLALPQAARVAPLTVAAAPGGGDPLACGGPVPAILYGRLEVLAITSCTEMRSLDSASNILTFEVTLPASSPDVVKVLLLDQVLDPPRLGGGLNGDGIHAELSAVIPGTLNNITCCRIALYAKSQ